MECIILLYNVNAFVNGMIATRCLTNDTVAFWHFNNCKQENVTHNLRVY